MTPGLPRIGWPPIMALVVMAATACFSNAVEDHSFYVAIASEARPVVACPRVINHAGREYCVDLVPLARIRGDEVRAAFVSESTPAGADSEGSQFILLSVADEVMGRFSARLPAEGDVAVLTRSAAAITPVSAIGADAIFLTFGSHDERDRFVRESGVPKPQSYAVDPAKREERLQRALEEYANDPERRALQEQFDSLSKKLGLESEDAIHRQIQESNQRIRELEAEIAAERERH